MTERDVEGTRAPTVMVMAKTPEPGRVKTRLCPPCTPEQAATIASAALADTFRAVAALDGVRPVVVLDGEAGPWIPRDFEVVEQVSGGLGRRLDAAFCWAAAQPGHAPRGHPRVPPPVGPSVLVGMDTPQVTAAAIRSALCELGAPGVDAVIGPAHDGGYWIIGFTSEVVTRRLGPFEGVPMSTAGTGEAQVARLEALGLNYRVLGGERDIDCWEDATAVAEQFPDLETSSAVARVADELLGRR